jgi:PII-like signaling protein
MAIEGKAVRLSVYLGSSDRWHGVNLAVAIVERCRKLGYAGATVTRGLLGYGRHSRIHRAHLLGLSEDLPEKVEVIDRAERIAELIPLVREMMSGGLMVVEDVEVVAL